MNYIDLTLLQETCESILSAAERNDTAAAQLGAAVLGGMRREVVRNGMRTTSLSAARQYCGADAHSGEILSPSNEPAPAQPASRNPLYDRGEPEKRTSPAKVVPNTKRIDTGR